MPSISVGNAPEGIAVTPDGNYVYVTNNFDGTVSVIRTSDNSVLDAPIAVGDGPFGVAVTPAVLQDESYYVYSVYVGNRSDHTVSVIKIKTSDNSVLEKTTIDVGYWPYGVAVAPDGGYVYVANKFDDNVSVIQTSDNSVVNTIAVGDGPFGVAVTPAVLQDESYYVYSVYVGNRSDHTVSVIKIKTSDNSVLEKTTIDVGYWPYGVAVAPDGGYVYVANKFDDNVSVIQTSDNSVVNTIDVGVGPFGVAVTPNGGYVYVTNRKDGTVSVIRTSDNSVVKTILLDVRNAPEGVAVAPNGNYVYVANSSSGTVSVIGF